MKKTFRVPNISCDHCVMTIRRELGDLEGVRSVEGDAKSQTVALDFDEERIRWESLSALLEEIHYPPEKS